LRGQPPLWPTNRPHGIPYLSPIPGTIVTRIVDDRRRACQVRGRRHLARLRRARRGAIAATMSADIDTLNVALGEPPIEDVFIS